MKSWFSKQVLKWYAIHGRHDLPWKQAINPYRVWVSEIMLQQTQVFTVIPYFEKFMNTFPTVAALAKANIDEVLQHWAGLGYYARGRNLHKTAQQIIKHHQGKFPQTVDELVLMPGIGPSTAGAIIAQAFDKKATICDGNVKRVLSRFHCVEGALGQKEVELTLWELADSYTPDKQVADYTQAIMDIGATICTRSKPNCPHCPLKSRCAAFKHNQQTLYPQRRKTKKIPTRQTFMLYAKNKEQDILLEQRPEKGIWGGLYSLPEFESEKSMQAFIRNLGLTKPPLQPLPQIKHTFTHYHLLIDPILLNIEKTTSKATAPSLRWVKAKDLKKLGLPAPIKKLLTRTTT